MSVAMAVVAALQGIWLGTVDPWSRAEADGRDAQRAIRFARNYAFGWLGHADPASGLLPRNVTGDAFWNAQDAAADNYPFLVLTALVTDDVYLGRIARQILETEQRLTSRLDRLPDDYDLISAQFRFEQIDPERIIFGAAEYAKDGLIPITEWHGPGPWRDRMEQLLIDIFRQASHDSPAGRLPSRNVEVIGDLLQVASRLYWMTGDERCREYALGMADQYLLHDHPADWQYLQLVDHGSEIIGGLTEACVIAATEDAERWRVYEPAIRRLLDRVLEIGVNPDGMLYSAINPAAGEVVNPKLSDTWGYVYNGFLTIARLSREPRYEQAVVHALSRLERYTGAPWGDSSADGYADSIEGALNLLNRLPDQAGFRWVETQTEALLGKQREDGLIEGWHGDGNCTRTVLMYALWKTQGVTVSPWRADLRLGAVPTGEGGLHVFLACDWPWSGVVRFDRPRHRELSYLPLDYPRINQWPEWFTVRTVGDYRVTAGSKPPVQVKGRSLLAWPASARPDQPLRLTVTPLPAAGPLRLEHYTSRSADQARRWQQDLREKLAMLLRISDLPASRPPLNPVVLWERQERGFRWRELEISTLADRRIRVVLTLPADGSAPFPAVICLHGHGADRYAVYQRDSIYRGFAAALAENGFVTLAADIGQHEVHQPGRTLIGERLWDLVRCLDLLESLGEVDRRRIGCAGLSLGGEMAMWLAAMDERVTATVSSGFLTVMDQMEFDHCMCWKFDGLRELVDFADIYSLIAPRPLLCQNGLAEPPNMFTVPLARQAMREIRTIYADLGSPAGAVLGVHPGGHEIDLPGLLVFLGRHLGGR